MGSAESGAGLWSVVCAERYGDRSVLRRFAGGRQHSVVSILGLSQRATGLDGWRAARRQHGSTAVCHRFASGPEGSSVESVVKS